jgi:hypothetical protein
LLVGVQGRAKWANMCDNLMKLVPLKRLTFPSDINEQLCEVCALSIESNIEIVDFVAISNSSAHL